MPRYKELLIGPTLAVVSVLLLLGAAELGVRLTKKAPVVHRMDPRAKESAYRLSENPVLGYVFKENFRSEHPDQHSSFSYINSHGQRDKERAIQKPNGTKRILVLGDSVVAGHGIHDRNDLLPQQMETLFADDKIEVLNLGIGGYCTRSEVELLKERALKFSPDLVVLIFVENDFTNSNARLIRRLGFTRPDLIEKLFVSSHFFRWLSMRYNLLNFRDEFDPADKFVTNSLAVGDNNVEEGFSLLAELAKENGFEVLIAAWPTFAHNKVGYKNHEWADQGQTRLVVENLARKYGLRTIRLAPVFQSHLEAVKRELPPEKKPSPLWSYTTGDGTHPSANGAKVAAQGLMEYVKSEGLL